MYATCRLKRCLLLNGAWLSHSAYDARMVKMVVAIVLERVEDDISNLNSMYPCSLLNLLTTSIISREVTTRVVTRHNSYDHLFVLPVGAWSAQDQLVYGSQFI